MNAYLVCYGYEATQLIPLQVNCEENLVELFGDFMDGAVMGKRLRLKNKAGQMTVDIPWEMIHGVVDVKQNALNNFILERELKEKKESTGGLLTPRVPGFN